MIFVLYNISYSHFYFIKFLYQNYIFNISFTYIKLLRINVFPITFITNIQQFQIYPS